MRNSIGSFLEPGPQNPTFKYKRVFGVLGKLISFSKPQFLHLCPQYLAHHLRVQ